MKKRFLTVLITLLIMGCGNFMDNESRVSIMTYLKDSGRAVYTPTKIELWISDPGVDYKLTKDADLEKRVYWADDTEASIDLNTSVVRYIMAENTSSIDFDIKVDVTKKFTLRVEFSDGYVYVGAKEQLISQLTEVISIGLEITPTSYNEKWFSEFDKAGFFN